MEESSKFYLKVFNAFSSIPLNDIKIELEEKIQYMF